MRVEVQQDDLTSDEVQLLIAEHLAGMHSNSPPGHVNALAIQGLKAPNVTFWVARLDGLLCGCGALKELDSLTGEIKSMRTRTDFLRRGIGQAVLDEIMRTARQRGYSRVLLETGTGPAFEAAHRLYRRNGFESSGPFAAHLLNGTSGHRVDALELSSSATILGIFLCRVLNVIVRSVSSSFQRQANLTMAMNAADDFSFTERSDCSFHPSQFLLAINEILASHLALGHVCIVWIHRFPHCLSGSPCTAQSQDE